MPNVPFRLTQPSSLLAIGLTAALLTCLPQSASGADPEIVEIKLSAGNFVLVPAQKEIKEGQSIKWVPVDLPDVEHHLKARSPTPDDAFEETDDFDGDNPPMQAFNKTGEINYLCTKHPKSMRGTITVKPASQ